METAYDITDNYNWISENWVHPSAHVAPTVKMGRGNIIGPNTVIMGHVTMGDKNAFLNCTIGAPGEKQGFFFHKDGHVLIGSNCIFREYVTVNAGTTHVTQIDDGVIMLRSSHVGHDSRIESGVTLSCNSVVGGHSHVMKKANFGLGAVCHQFSVIGSYTMLGMNAVVTKKSQVLPGNIYKGVPIGPTLKINTVGLQRSAVTNDMLLEERRRYNHIVEMMNG